MSSGGDMSEDDAELRDVVFKELESSGILAKIKAELMASVVVALEKGDAVKKIPLRNQGLRDFLSTADGVMCHDILSDFLEFYDLRFSAVIFKTETGLSDRERQSGRGDVLRQLNIPDTKSKSLLSQIVTHSKRDNSALGAAAMKTGVRGPTNFTPVLSKHQVENIKNLFNTHDKDSDGFLSESETCELMSHLCPHFSSSFLTALCTSEIKQATSHTRSTTTQPKVSLAQFNSIYQRFYTSCYTVIHQGQIGENNINSLNPGGRSGIGQQQQPSDYSFEFEDELDAGVSDGADVSVGDVSPQTNGRPDNKATDDLNDLLQLGDDLSTDRTISEAQAPNSFDFVENIN